MSDLENKITRLDVQVEGLTKEIHGVRNLLMAGQTPGHVALEERVSSLDKQLEKLDKSIENLSAKLERSTRIPAGFWTVVGIMVTIATGIIGYTINGINQDIVRVEKEIAELRPIIVPRSELEARSTQTQKRLERLESKFGR